MLVNPARLPSNIMIAGTYYLPGSKETVWSKIRCLRRQYENSWDQAQTARSSFKSEVERTKNVPPPITQIQIDG